MAARIVALGVLALLAGTAPAASAQRDRTPRPRIAMEGQSIDTAFRMERGGLVDLELVSGEIIVTGIAGNEVRIRASTDEGYVTLRASSTLTALRVEHDRDRERGRNRNRSENTRYEIGIPAGVRVVMEATSGNLTARGVEADVDASTVSGNVDLRDIGGMANAEVVSGSITASGLRGGIHVETTSGTVSVTNVDGEVLIENTSGHITLRDIRSKLVQVESVSGNLRFDGAIDPAGRYEFETHSGTIWLGLPATTAAQLELSTFSGSLQSDFPITLNPRQGSSGKRLEFKLGNGGARITAETFSGSVIITRGAGRDRQE